MPIGPQVYPVMAGQIIVCCCKRLSRTEFRMEKVISKLAISLPKKYKGPGKDEDFTKLFKEKLNNYLRNDNYANKVHMSIEDVFFILQMARIWIRKTKIGLQGVPWQPSNMR